MAWLMTGSGNLMFSSTIGFSPGAAPVEFEIAASTASNFWSKKRWSCGIVLAWLRPTETLALSEVAAPLAGLSEALAKAAGGHVVDLSGGLKAFRMRGARVADLLSRLGSAALGMGPGHARRGRFGDVPVLALSVRAGEVLLVVDRAYAAHLGGWIEATLADWT